MGMGDHYAATRRLWEERFVERSREVGELGFDAVFQWMWLFYLCYSRAGFQSGYLDVQQIVLDCREVQLQQQQLPAPRRCRQPPSCRSVGLVTTRGFEGHVTAPLGCPGRCRTCPWTAGDTPSFPRHAGR
jgi:hypothetical protein